MSWAPKKQLIVFRIFFAILLTIVILVGSGVLDKPEPKSYRLIETEGECIGIVSTDTSRSVRKPLN